MTRTIKQHDNPTQSRPTRGSERYDEDVWARAPYNFVPLPKAIVKAGGLHSHDQYHAGTHTGHVICTLTTCSPTYIRGMLTEAEYAEMGEVSAGDLTDAQKERRSPFFALGDDAPVLPGSSLRGLIRAMVEIASYGKVTMVTDEPLVYRAVADGQHAAIGIAYKEQVQRGGVRAGYVRWLEGQWKIQPALPIMGGTGSATSKAYPFAVTQHLISETERSSFMNAATPWHHAQNAWLVDTMGEFAEDRTDGSKTGEWYVQVKPGSAHVYVETGKGIGRTGEGKRNYVFGQPDSAREESAYVISDELERLYREQLTPAQRKLLGAEGVLQDYQPVFYLLNDQQELVFFGHARNFRLPYERTPLAFVPEALRREEDVDFAEAMFGYVGKPRRDGQDGEAYAGRVFVGDAYLVERPKALWYDAASSTKPQILSSPKPTTFQHYLVQDGNLGHHPDNKEALAHYGTSIDETEIRGHKLYHHKGNAPDFVATPGNANDPDHQSQYTRIRPINTGVTFEFVIRFDNLRDEELGALLWVLGLPETYRLKLGMGKPLGLGAVKVEVKADGLVLTDRTERYKTLFDNSQWHTAGRVERDAGQFVQRFKDAVCKAVAPQSVTPFEQLARIQAFLEMLKWPGPDPAWTRYMEIERRENGQKVNEYKERPVLPDVWYSENTPERTPIRRPPIDSPLDDKADITVKATPMGSTEEPAAVTASVQTMVGTITKLNRRGSSRVKCEFEDGPRVLTIANVVEIPSEVKQFDEVDVDLQDDEVIAVRLKA